MRAILAKSYNVESVWSTPEGERPANAQQFHLDIRSRAFALVYLSECMYILNDFFICISTSFFFVLRNMFFSKVCKDVFRGF